jgi:hypothetical protein
MTTVLSSPRVDVDEDPRAFAADALARGWSDGLPIVHPTEDLVAEYVAASGLGPDFMLGRLYPLNAVCTVERLAVNAVMAGAPAQAMRLMCAAVSALADPSFDLAGINATTASVVPAFVVSGPVRDELGIPYRHSAWGGAAGPAPAIGRALRLVIRNVAGQDPGVTSQVVFGQPGRVAGIIAAEWEEESPWPPLGERRGTQGSSVTAFGVLGTANILNSVGTDGAEILEVIGKSLAYMGNNNMDKGSSFAHQLVAVNPVWAQKISAQYPRMQDVQEKLYTHATLPVEWFPRSLRPVVEGAHHYRDGRVYLMDSPDDVSVVVNGGKGNLHGTMFPGMSNCLPVTRSLDAATWEASKKSS